MKVVILAGGRGTRISEETSPKPMVEVGGKPMLWHIMNIYAAHGYREFLVACGYKGDHIKEYFHNFFIHSNDYVIDLKDGSLKVLNTSGTDWKIGVIDTGLDTQTGGRIKRLASWIGDDTFMVTYGDGVAAIDIPKLVEFHRKHGRLATVTAVRPPARFGGLNLKGDTVKEFSEKPQAGEGWINGGFFVFEPGTSISTTSASCSASAGVSQILSSFAKPVFFDTRCSAPPSTVKPPALRNSGIRFACPGRTAKRTSWPASVRSEAHTAPMARAVLPMTAIFVMQLLHLQRFEILRDHPARGTASFRPSLAGGEAGAHRGMARLQAFVWGTRSCAAVHCTKRMIPFRPQRSMRRYCALMPCSLNTARHFLISAFKCAVISSGVLAITSKPRSCQRFVVSGVRSAARTFSLSAEMIGAGVAFGAAKICQVVNS
jgi:glucose-1-phosphate cytidylyltransferase